MTKEALRLVMKAAPKGLSHAEVDDMANQCSREAQLGQEQQYLDYMKLLSGPGAQRSIKDTFAARKPVSGTPGHARDDAMLHVMHGACDAWGM
jgi:hypothetical protein